MLSNKFSIIELLDSNYQTCVTITIRSRMTNGNKIHLLTHTYHSTMLGESLQTRKSFERKS